MASRSVSPQPHEKAAALYTKPNAKENRLLQESCSAINKTPGKDLTAIRSGAKDFTMYFNGGPNMITTHILLGNREDAANYTALRKLGVTHILNAAQQVPNQHPGEFCYHKLNILDSPDTNIVAAYVQEDTGRFMRNVERRGGRVLVHCVSGVSRSASLVIIHLMEHHNIRLRIAYDYVVSCRSSVSPNDGFKLQLANYELKLFGESTVSKNNMVGKAWDFYAWNSIKHSVRSAQDKSISAPNSLRSVKSRGAVDYFAGNCEDSAAWSNSVTHVGQDNIRSSMSLSSSSIPVYLHSSQPTTHSAHTTQKHHSQHEHSHHSQSRSKSVSGRTRRNSNDFTQIYNEENTSNMCSVM